MKNYLGAGALFLIGFLFFAGLIFTIQSETSFLAKTSFVSGAASGTATAVLEVGNAAPSVSAVSLNGNSAITLTANATTAVNVSAVISDNNGCADIQNGTTTILVYRSGVTSSTCLTTQNNLNCYLVTSFTASSTCSTNFVNATATVGVYYFAEPTDASNSLYSSQSWLATVIFKDRGNTTGSNDSTGVDVNSLTAIEVGTSSINYGTLNASTTTGFVNQVTGVSNRGNTTTTLLINGTAMTLAANKIATSSQHYASSSFYYGGNEQALQGTATTVSGVALLPRVSLINNIGNWMETAVLPNSPNDAAYANSNGYTYVTGGRTTSTVRFAAFNADGTLGSWTNTTAMSVSRFDHGALVYNGYIYVIAGDNLFPDVDYAPLSATGSVGVWSSTNAPTAGGDFFNFSTVASNGYIYVLGGDGTGGFANDVQYSTFNSDGSLNTWTALGDLPNVVAQHASVINNGYIYVIGGRTTSSVLFAPINSSGTLGTWTHTTALPEARYDHGAAVLGGYLYVFGGSVGTSVAYAAFNSDGTLGAWATTTVLSAETFDTRAAVNNGYAYAFPNDGSTTTVIYAQINNGRSQRDIFWGLGIDYVAPGTYSGVNTFTASYQP